VNASSVSTRLLLIDNYDSFTYNLVQAFMVLGAEVLVHRNDQISVDAARALAPTHLCISPGPGTPYDAGVSMQMIAAFAGQVPVLGVCLGHQSLVEVFGGKVVRAARLMHGKIDEVAHDGRGVYAALPPRFSVVRYHSLAIERASLPAALDVTSTASDGEIMGVRHRALAGSRTPLEGVQFHPESILTEHGHAMLKNFLEALP
jgi:anthranilate synthase component II